MKIGYSVEGGADRAFLAGLRDRWCPHAEIIQGSFRGRTGVSMGREIPHTCMALMKQGVDVIIFLKDSDKKDWRDILNDHRKRCKPEHSHLVIFGVCERNVECWLCADCDYIARQFGKTPGEFLWEDTKDGDPKNVVQSCFKSKGRERLEVEIAEFVTKAPLRKWLHRSKSFEHFYDSIWAKSKEMGCGIENLRMNE
ncbi:MAG: hypothetical protein NTX50_11470 [Candidatus Sumerlaeota bacterium]|nr:hypothetical protein [Candidatus Sumerlaeota bacterium]